MKKFLWLFVSFVIVCSVTFMLAFQVQAASSSGKCGDNLTYSYSNGVLTISGTGKMSDSMFDNNKNIKSVIINEGVTSICTRAFYGCENLTNISLPSTIEQIDGQAFLKTSYYNSQENWEDGVLYIGNHLIEAKDNLAGNYSIKSGTITIAYMAFDNCANLTGIVLPDSVKFIGSEAFDRCSALASVSMSKNIKRIDSWAFGYMGACSKLKTINLPNTVIDIESTAFRKTGFAQNSGNWKNGMLYIGNHLVDGGDKNYCEVADGTIDIARAAFEDGSNIKIISIPKTVKHIGAYQTYNCHSLKKIYYEGSQSEWNSIVAEPNNDLNTHNIVFGQKHQHTLRIVKENEIVATCTKNGEYVNVSYCEECESEIKRDFITISAKGHIFGNWEQIKVATCTEGGKETRTCTKCKYTETKEYDALGHKEVIDNKVEPTCTKTGLTEGKYCSVCEEVLIKQNNIEATGIHIWDKGKTDKNGNIYYECDTCEAAYSKNLLSIKVTSKPTKLSYVEHDYIDFSGMVITAYYDNNTTAIISSNWSASYGMNAGTQTVIVEHCGKVDTFTISVKAKVPSTITSSKHTISGNNISKITAGTTVSSLLSGLNEGSYCKVYKGSSEVSGNTAVVTGMVVKIMDGNTVKASYTVIVTGDTNGDGTISVTDMIAIKAHILNKSTLTGVYATAANTNGDSGISITDFIQVKAKIHGKGSITAR